MRILLLTVVLVAPVIAIAQTATSNRSNPRTRQQAQNNLVLSDSFTYYSADTAADTGKEVGLKLNDAAPDEALRELFEQAKENYVLEGDAKSPRISVAAQNVRFRTALDLITQAAGLKYVLEVKDGKKVYRLGKNVKPSNAPWYQLPGNLTNSSAYLLKPDQATRLFTAPNSLGADLNVSRNFAPLLYNSVSVEDRSTFNCPHCKSQTTVIRKKQQPKCTKCQRAFQSDWQFCPVDGTKRPASAGPWKYCPVCGKEVQPDRAETKTGAVDVLRSSVTLDPVVIDTPVNVVKPNLELKVDPPAVIDNPPLDPRIN